MVWISRKEEPGIGKYLKLREHRNVFLGVPHGSKVMQKLGDNKHS